MISSLKNYDKIGHIFDENIDDLIFILNSQFQCKYFNFPNIIGGKIFSDFINEIDNNQITKLLKNILKNGQSTFEVQIKIEDNNFNWYEIKGRKFIDEEDNQKINLK